MSVIQMILALSKSLDILDKWLTALTVEYTKAQREKGNVEFDKAMAKARATSSTEDLAASIGADLD